MVDIKAFKEAVLIADLALQEGNQREAWDVLKERFMLDQKIQETEEFIKMCLSDVGRFVADSNKKEFK